MTDYQVRLDTFEGPLDLLLHLIKKNEVDIWDIPISTITEQYLEYLEMMKMLNLDVAGEFLLMAATLMHIKSRMLLPAHDEEETEEDAGDPREELVRRLLEYKKYREASRELVEMEVLGRDTFRRGYAEEVDEEAADGIYTEITLFDLLEALKEVLKESRVFRSHEVNLEKVSVKEKMDAILERLKREGHVTLHSLFDADSGKGQVVATFLALLELVKMKMVKAFQGENFGPIRIVSRETLH